MQRNLNELANGEFDLVIVGGGIFGVWLAMEATTRGLTAALVERGDFVSATSASCFKIAHGGIRYLQHGDIYRMYQSCKERQILLRIAPHLVAPLPILIPTYGKGKRGKAFLRFGCGVYDFLTWNRNRGIADPARHMPSAYSLSRGECLRRFPGLENKDLTGGVVFHDGQIFNPARLGLAILRSAQAQGAQVANYVEATSLLERDGRIIGVRVADRLGAHQFEIRGNTVINAAGPWAPIILGRQFSKPATQFSRDACFILPQEICDGVALAVPGATSDPDAILSRSHRHLFIVPWRNCTMIGVWHKLFTDDPDKCRPSDGELSQFLNEINHAYPSLNLSPDDVSLTLSGLVPCAGVRSGHDHLRFGKRSQIIDHQRTDRLHGLISIIGVRYTTARCEAKRVVELASRKMDRALLPSRSATEPVWGGDFDKTESLLRQAHNEWKSRIDSDAISGLVQNHGASYNNVLGCINENASLTQCFDHSTVIKAEVVHAVREEMALRLSDVAFRRTNLATGSIPTESALSECAQLMGQELKWSQEQQSRELNEVQNTLRARSINELLS